jgi:hypothetical protein
MSDSYSSWSDVKARCREGNPRTEEERTAGKAAARERREAYVGGHRLARCAPPPVSPRPRSPARSLDPAP